VGVKFGGLEVMVLWVSGRSGVLEGAVNVLVGLLAGQLTSLIGVGVVKDYSQKNK